jgi:hypothetical protein
MSQYKFENPSQAMQSAIVRMAAKPYPTDENGLYIATGECGCVYKWDGETLREAKLCDAHGKLWMEGKHAIHLN